MGMLDKVRNFANNKNRQVMKNQEKEANALLIHIEHSKPIEIKKRVEKYKNHKFDSPGMEPWAR